LLVNPFRPHRMELRVKKRRPKSFPCMVKPQQEVSSWSSKSSDANLMTFGSDPLFEFYLMTERRIWS
jgi:hypothetical protein